MKKLNYIRLFYYLKILLISCFLIGCSADDLPEEARRKIKKINSTLSLLAIEERDVVNINGESPTLEYIIHYKDNATGFAFFEIREYEKLAIDDQTILPTQELCKVLNALGEVDNPVLQSLNKLNISTKASFFNSLELEIDNIEKVLFELLYSIHKIKEIQAQKIKILIKGYADSTQTTTWTEPLKTGVHFYDRIKLKPVIPSDINRNYYINYQNIDTTIVIPPRYSNPHLPNLRAKYIEDELINRSLKGCNIENDTEIEVSILQGNTFDDTRDPKLRKVDIIIHMFFD